MTLVGEEGVQHFDHPSLPHSYLRVKKWRFDTLWIMGNLFQIQDCESPVFSPPADHKKLNTTDFTFFQILSCRGGRWM